MCNVGFMSETITKSSRKKMAASLIDSYKDGDVFSDVDCETMSALCGYAFTSVSKSKHRMISVDCPSESYSGTWSWNKSIDGYSDKKNTLQAMRSAIKNGSFGKHPKVLCAVCRDDQGLAVDHKTTAFSKIASSYIADHGSPDITNISGFGWVLNDEKHFLRYHDSIADYQTLCRSCNSKKGTQ